MKKLLLTTLLLLGLLPLNVFAVNTYVPWLRTNNSTTSPAFNADNIQFNGDIGSQNYFGTTGFFFKRNDGSLLLTTGIDGGTGCQFRLLAIEATTQTFCVDYNGDATLYGTLTAKNFVGTGLSTSTFAGGVQAVGLSSTNGLTVSGTGTSTLVNTAFAAGKSVQLDGNLYTKNNVGITYLAIDPTRYNMTLIGPSDGGDNILFQIKSNTGISNVFTVRDGGLPGVPGISIGNFNIWPEVANIADFGSGLLPFRSGYFGTKISVGTTSPFATLSVGGAAGQTTPLVLMSTSTTPYATSTAFIIDSNGKVGVATTSSYLPFGVQGGTASSYFNADDKTATSTFYGGLLLAMSGGNVAIATTSSLSRLTVNGSVTLGGGSATAPSLLSGLNGANSLAITIGSGVPTTGNSGATTLKSANTATGSTGAVTAGSGNASNSTSGANDFRTGTGFSGTGSWTGGSGVATNNASGQTSLIVGNCSASCPDLLITGGNSSANAISSNIVITSGAPGTSNGNGAKIILRPMSSAGSATNNGGSVWVDLIKDAQMGLGSSTPGARLSIQGQINGLRQIMSVATTSLTSTSTVFTIDQKGLTILGMASTSSSTSSYFPASAWLTIASSSRSQAQIQLDLGATPETPNDGQIWNATSTNSTETYTGYMWGTLRRRLFTATNDQTINTSAETTALSSSYMGSSTIAGNFPTVGTQLLITGEGVYSTPVGNVETVTVKAKYGATTLTTVTTAAFPASATNQPFRFFEKCTVRAVGASGSIICNGQLEYQTVISGTNVWVTNALDNGGAATTIDTTIKSNLDVTVDWSQTAFTTQSIKVNQSSIDSN